MKRLINHGQATRSTLICARVIHFIVPLSSHLPARCYSEVPLRTSDRLIDDHPRNWLSVLFLLGCVDAMRLRINGQAMDRMLNGKVFQLTVVIWIIFMEDGNSAAVTRDIDAAETSIELDDIRSVCKREKGDRYMLVQIEDGHQIVFFACKKGAAMLRVQRHSVISLTLPNRIFPYHLVRRGINDHKDVLVLQIDVYLTGDGVVLRHAGFTVEMQCAHNLVLLHVHDGFRFASFIGNVKFMKRN